MTGIATITGEGEEVTVLLFMAHRVAANAGDCNRWRIGGETLTGLNNVFGVLAGIDAMADGAVAQVDGVDLAHVICHMAGHAADRGRDHVMLNIGRRDWVVEGVFGTVAVGAVLHLADGAVGDGVDYLLACAGVTLGTGVFGLVESHDVDDTGRSRVRAVVTWRAERVGGQIVHVTSPRFNVAQGAVWWRLVEGVMRWFLGGV